jgi:hypothetical protein
MENFRLKSIMKISFNKQGMEQKERTKESGMIMELWMNPYNDAKNPSKDAKNHFNRSSVHYLCQSI